MPAANTPLPRWDLSSLYSDLNSDAFNQAIQDVGRLVGELESYWDEEGIGVTPAPPTDSNPVQVIERAITLLGQAVDHVATTVAYLHGHISTDSRDSRAQILLSEAQRHLVTLDKLDTRFAAWLGGLSLELILQASAEARQHEYMLRRAQTEAKHQMSPAEESLASELHMPAGNAWSRLYSDVSSQIMVEMPTSKGAELLPMSQVRNLDCHPDRETRRAAYRAELAAWEKAAVPLAAAFNGIKGEDNVLVVHRRWPSPLDVALFKNHIDRATLDAMMSAAQDSLPRFHTYLRAKAAALGLPRLAWYDLAAPVGNVNRESTFEEAQDFILTHFGAFSARLAVLARRAFDEHWIDAEPREGKHGGGFCMSLVAGQSRILVNFVPSFDGVSTLAHELGHAYHNAVLADRPPLLRVGATPSTLAETASTFCETIIRRAALAEAAPDARLGILSASLAGTCEIVVDITSRFLFESRAFEARRAGATIEVGELNELMLESQKVAYGQAVDERGAAPYMWAAKPHYYRGWASFYNFPYMFGQLLGLGLFATYASDPERFLTSYDDFLDSTGHGRCGRAGHSIRSRRTGTSVLEVEPFDLIREASTLSCSWLDAAFTPSDLKLPLTTLQRCADADKSGISGVALVTNDCLASLATRKMAERRGPSSSDAASSSSRSGWSPVCSLMYSSSASLRANATVRC